MRVLKRLKSIEGMFFPSFQYEQHKQVFVVGAQKAGTTALYHYLKNHEQICVPDVKEPAFFNRDREYQLGISYYRSYFPFRINGRHILDCSPGYFYYSLCAERIKKEFPEAKIVCLLREPVSRALSGYNMYHQILKSKRFDKRISTANDTWRRFLDEYSPKGEIPTLETFLNRELEIISRGEEEDEPSLIRRGIYAPQIQRFVDMFGRDNVLILLSDDLLYRTKMTVNQVLSFAGLKPLNSFDENPKHVRKYSVDTSESESLIRQYSGTMFDEDKRALESAFNIKVYW